MHGCHKAHVNLPVNVVPKSTPSTIVYFESTYGGGAEEEGKTTGTALYSCCGTGIMRDDAGTAYVVKVSGLGVLDGEAAALSRRAKNFLRPMLVYQCQSKSDVRC